MGQALAAVKGGQKAACRALDCWDEKYNGEAGRAARRPHSGQKDARPLFTKKSLFMGE